MEFGFEILTRWDLCFCTTIHILVIFLAWRRGQATEQDSQCVAVVAGVSALARRDVRAGQVGYPRTMWSDIRASCGQDDMT